MKKIGGKNLSATTMRRSEAKTPSRKDVALDEVKQAVKGRKSGPKATQKK